MKKCFLIMLFVSLLFSCSERKINKTNQEKAVCLIENYLKEKSPDIDSIMVASLKEIQTTCYDNAQYNYLYNKKENIQNQIYEEANKRNKYTNDFSSKGKYLNSEYSYSIKRKREEIYEIEEQMDEIRASFISEFKGYSALVKYKYNGKIEYREFEFNSSISELTENFAFAPDPINVYVDSLSNKCGLMRKDFGEIVVHAQYDSIEFEGGHLYKVRKEANCGIINEEGKIVMPIKYKDIGIIRTNDNQYSSDWYAWFEFNDKYGIINKDCNVIIRPEYDGIYFNSLYPDYFFVKKGGKDIGRLYDASNYDGLWGIIDLNSQIIAPLKYTFKYIRQNTNYIINSKKTSK